MIGTAVDGATAGHPDATVRPITDREFDLFQSLIYREAGIYLARAKKALLMGRLSRRLRTLCLNSFGAYYERVTDPDGDELMHLLDHITTNETRFFREPAHFEFLENQVCPEWVAQGASRTRPRQIRVWSAACSTGEEPYSLAMVLSSRLSARPSTEWQTEILASDVSTRALERAREAVWPINRAKEIPSQYLKAYMLQGTRSQEGRMKAGPKIRSLVRFERINLNDEVYPVTGLFDLIFCRNVLIYFSPESKRRVVDRLLRHLAPEGYMFLGQSESLNGLTDRVRSVVPTVYSHAER